MPFCLHTSCEATIQNLRISPIYRMDHEALTSVNVRGAPSTLFRRRLGFLAATPPGDDGFSLLSSWMVEELACGRTRNGSDKVNERQ